MKATGLRIAVGIVASVALVGGGLAGLRTAVAADDAKLKSAFDDYAAGRDEDALKKLQEYVAENPGDDEVYRVLRTVDERLKVRALAKQGEHERLMRYLLDKARPAVEARKRDPDRIQKLVGDAINGDLDVRRRAGMELAGAAGDYAVPYLLPHLGATDAEKVVNAIFAFHYLGSEAVMPLIEALNSSDARLRGYVAVVLGDIRDRRALPALRHAAASDADEGVKAKAAAAIAKIRPLGTPTSAQDSYVKFGELYYANDPGVISEVDEVHNLWRWEGDGLARYEVPAALFAYQVAEEHASDALAIQADHKGARSLLVRSVLAQQVAGSMMGEKAPEALKGAWDLLVSQGFGAASAALRDSLAAKDWDVAAASTKLIVATYGKQDLTGHPLGMALGSPERRVRYAAAIAALRMSPAGPFPNSNMVPDIAARAAAEEAVREVLLIDDHDDARGRMMADLRQQEFLVAADKDGYRGVARAKALPGIDVIVVRADLGDQANTIPSFRWRSTEAVIDELLSDARTKGRQVLVVVGASSAEMLAAKKDYLSKKYGDKLGGFIEEPLDTAAYVETIRAAAGKNELGKDRTRALAIAAEAADAFASTNAHCTAWKFEGTPP
jgi:HEAT repeat protein